MARILKQTFRVQAGIPAVSFAKRLLKGESERRIPVVRWKASKQEVSETLEVEILPAGAGIFDQASWSWPDGRRRTIATLASPN